jgi:hypothetical protein
MQGTGDTTEATNSQQKTLENSSNGAIVDFSGLPYSVFSRSTKALIVFLVALSALISPFAATLFYPALNVLAKQLHVSQSLVNLSITTYMVCHRQAVSYSKIC